MDDNEEYEQIREKYQAKNRKLTDLQTARFKKPQIEWKPEFIYKPAFTGTRVFENYDLNEIRKYIGVCSQFDILWGELTA